MLAQRLRSLLTANRLVVTLAVMGVALSASTPFLGAQTTGRDTLDLEDHMKQVSRALNRMRRIVPSPEENESSLALIARAQQHALAAKVMVPTKAEDMPRGQRKQFVTAFRQKMIELLNLTLKLEDEILAGRNQEAAKTYKQIYQLRKQGHKVFRKEEQ